MPVYVHNKEFTDALLIGERLAPFCFCFLLTLPNRQKTRLSDSVVRTGNGLVRDSIGWIWRQKWLVLTEQSLSIHKSKVRSALSTRPSLLSVLLSMLPWHLRASKLVLVRVPIRSQYSLGPYSLLPARAFSTLMTSQISSGQISNRVVCFCRQMTSSIASLCKMKKSYLAGRMICTPEVLS